ncbi:hypothetical protein PROFUN_16166 [Planoprotostelium fungivorum]|uniref:Uncharacterized protein n=1 Tax=Planoprotostelium fungivorum TaxID=1890364 RepID=A0A2P6MS46_9EUKA|nr:hypothetical protein PROFUN_16166 [Planoprotostelium fungivorum]
MSCSMYRIPYIFNAFSVLVSVLTLSMVSVRFALTVRPNRFAVISTSIAFPVLMLIFTAGLFIVLSSKYPKYEAVASLYRLQYPLKLIHLVMTQFEMKMSPQQRKDQTSEQSQKNNGAERSLDECTNNWTKSITTTPPKEDKQGTSSIYKVNIDRDKVLNELKRQEREIRTQYNKEITIDFEKLKSKRKEIKRRQKEIKDPGYVFKLLKTVGKKSTRNNDKPHIIEEANGTKSSDPEKADIICRLLAALSSC